MCGRKGGIVEMQGRRRREKGEKRWSQGGKKEEQERWKEVVE